jgi:hypothetical protein
MASRFWRARTSVALALVVILAGILGFVLSKHAGRVTPQITAAIPVSTPAQGFLGAVVTVSLARSVLIMLTVADATVTVNTTSSTRCVEENRSIRCSAIKANAVIVVRGSVSMGTVTAAEIAVQVPTLTGRVLTVSGTVVSMLTSLGFVAEIATTPATIYTDGHAAASRSLIVPGIHLLAEGAQPDLTHLTADVIVLGVGDAGRDG